jgi:zinc protease
MRSLIALLCLVLAGPATAVTLPTHEFTLDNGLRVLVREDHRAPVITVMVWYRVGSVDEPPGQTGISHVLEHMMFKDSEHLAPGEYSRLVSRFGGDHNAFTSRDFTAYYQQYEASRLPLALELEAERMHNLRIEDEEFDRERNVVLEERRQRVEDNPNALAHEKFMAVARPGTGYASPVIGWRRDLKNLTPEMARDWYQRHYHPANAVLVVAGDVTADQVRRQAKRFFADIPAGRAPAGLPDDPRPLPGERRMTLQVPVRVPTLFMGWNLPSLRTLEDPADYYALTMLAGVLDGGMSARLETRLVREQRLAASASAGYDGIQRGAGFFSISATPTPDTSLDDLEAALLEEVQSLRQSPPSAEELERVRAQVTASKVFEKDSLFGQAMQLGYLVTLGLDWRLAETFSDRLAEVTPEDVQRVASEYLVPARSTVAHVEVEAP